MAKSIDSLAAAMREAKRRQKEREVKNLLVIAELKSRGEYSDKEVALISQINECVMSADGIAEEWGGYNLNPLDYLSISIDIFEITKSFYSEQL